MLPARPAMGPALPRGPAAGAHLPSCRPRTEPMRLLTPPIALLLCCSTALSAVEGAHAIAIEGSSTVYPITIAVAERIAQQNPQLTAEVVCSGSTAGLRRLIAGEIPVANSSRPVRPDEIAKAAQNGIELIELPIAFDGVTVAINRRNAFVDKLTVEELRQLWKPGSTIMRWSQLRAGWPNEPIALFGKGKDSGTFDFFTEVVIGESRAIRPDYTVSTDNDPLVGGIAGNDYALGYFGYAFLKENEAVLRAVPIDNGQGPVAPSAETITSGAYRPLSRPLFIYVSKPAAARSEVAQFVDAFLRLVPQMVGQVGYVPLGERLDGLARARWAARTTGSLYAGAKPGQRLEDLLGVKPPGALATPQVASAAPAAAPVAPVPAPVITTSTQGAPATRSAAPPATSGPAAVRAPATSGDDQRSTLEQVQDDSLAVARLALDAATPLTELERRARELQARIGELALVTPDSANGRPATIADAETAAQEAAPGDAAYAALLDRLALNERARGALDDAALAAFRRAAVASTDPLQRRALASAVRAPGGNLARFTEAVAALGRGRADVDIILAYARGGLVLR